MTLANHLGHWGQALADAITSSGTLSYVFLRVCGQIPPH